MTRKNWLEKGKKCMEEGQHEKAIKYFDRIINANPDGEYLTIHRKGSSLVKLGRHEEAVECFKEALKIDPTYDTCAFDLGLLLYELGKLKEAREAFNRIKPETMLYGLDVKARDWLEKIDLEEGIAITKPGIDPEVEQEMKLLSLDPRITSIDSALSSAAGQGNIEAVEVFLKYGANPKYNPPSGWTPLLNAAKNGHGDIVKILLKEGADPNDQNVFAAHTPLILAAMGNHEEVVRILIEAGTDVNRKNQWGATALSKGRLSPEIEKMLVEAGAKE